MGSGAGRARRGGGLELELEEKESFEWAEKGRGGRAWRGGQPEQKCRGGKARRGSARDSWSFFEAGSPVKSGR